MTTEEKLDKALEFIKYIDSLDISYRHKFSPSDLEDESRCDCDECGNECYVTNIQLPSYVDVAEYFVSDKVIEDIKNKAWHLLVDLTD